MGHYMHEIPELVKKIGTYREYPVIERWYAARQDHAETYCESCEAQSTAG